MSNADAPAIRVGTASWSEPEFVRAGWYEGVFDAQIEVKVLGPDRQLVTSLTTDFSPRPIPNDYHGTIGRAWFSVRLPFVPKPGSTIQVIYRRTVP